MSEFLLISNASKTRAFPRFLSAALLGLLAGVAGCDRGSPTTETTTPQASEDASSARYDATFNLVNNSGTVRYDGTVDSDTSKAALIGALTHAYGADRIRGDIAVDPSARTPAWLGNIGPFLTAFDVAGAAVNFEGDSIELTGSVAEADRGRLLAAARELFPDAEYAGLFEGLGDASTSPSDPAAQALAGLPADAKPGQLVQALNLIAIQFEPGSAVVQPASLDIISKAGKAIAAAPDGTRIEIGGHTGSTGNAEDDLTLSKQRAEAVKVQLIVNGVSPSRLETKGYGQQAGDPAAAASDRVAFSVLP